ncbi:hypothetical protein [Acidovorax carolinensis]|uniref:hypothetical protein n=1 Tax=Acidovorax carolinensis TaxID=553814 RepID=UPI000B34480C|nr:hypothetical protein [Acidovorax carolinensis]ART48327.1 hypothetical protein CBP33_09480 [Acidovorax carolinensis]
MTPALPIPTDNIFKFACLFGLALIVSSIFGFVSIYTSSLDRKVKYSETVIALEAKEQKTKAESDLLDLTKKLIDVTKSNERTANSVIGVSVFFGILLSAYGALMWYLAVQKRDDKLVALQLEKMEIEIAKLRSDLAKPTTTKSENKTATDNEG